MGDELLTVEEMAKILLIKPNTMRSKKWRLQNGCPLKKRGRRLYSIKAEFIDWLLYSEADSKKLLKYTIGKYILRGKEIVECHDLLEWVRQRRR